MLRHVSSSLTASPLLLVALVLIAPKSSHAQGFNVIHAFSGGPDGANPYAGVTIDAAGNLYGTTAHGGDVRCSCGTAYKLKHSGAGWVLTVLYTFEGADDGAAPTAKLTIGPNGTLYGSTQEGGTFGIGTVFNLRPPARASGNIMGGWTETELYQFGQSAGDGAYPDGALIFDQRGNIYGTNTIGGVNGTGTVFELTPSNGDWTETVIFQFGVGGGDAYAGLTFDSNGNLYGAASGVPDLGEIFELSPSGSGWAEHTLYYFHGGSDGKNPHGGVIFDRFGSLYGTALYGGSRNGGTAFELIPSNGNWTFNLLYALPGSGEPGPVGSLAMDAAGNLYGVTTYAGAYGYGSVFKLVPKTGGGWTYVDLHDFTGGSDGQYPLDGVTLDGNGDVYGTASSVNISAGVVFEITP